MIIINIIGWIVIMKIIFSSILKREMKAEATAGIVELKRKT